MKRLLLCLVFIFLMFSVSVTCAEERAFTLDEQAYDAYLDISYAMENSITYLEEMERLWNIVLQADNFEDIHNLTRIECVAEDRLLTLNNMYLQKYGYSEKEYQECMLSSPDLNFKEKTDLIWYYLGLGIEAKYLVDLDSLLLYLEDAMTSIRSIMANDREYPFLKDLQNYYKETSLILNYAKDFNDNYVGLSQKLDDYSTRKESWNIDFEFIFFEDEFDYVRESRNTKERARMKEIYDQALGLELDGKYDDAVDWYWACFSYEDAPERLNVCLNTFKAQQYEIAVGLQKNGQYEQAILLYRQIGAYKDSVKQIATCTSALILEKLFPSGISFATSRSELIAMTGKDTKEYTHSLNTSGSVLKTGKLKYRYYDKNDQLQMTSVYHNLYGNTISSEAKSKYLAALQELTGVCGTPCATEQTYSRPTYNKLKGNTANLVSGSAYKEKDFDGKIETFAEWLLDTGKFYINIIVYNKYFPAHMFYEVSTLYELIPYSAIN